MAEFTKEQLQEIKNSNEFKEFVEKWEKEGIDRNATLDDYLGNILNHARWKDKFSASKDTPLQDEQKSVQEELAKTEHDLEVYLHTVYADGILQKGKDLPEKFWETDDYKRWADNYNDKETQELKDRIQQLQAKNVEKEKILQSQERYVPDLVTTTENVANKQYYSEGSTPDGYTSDEWKQIIDGFEDNGMKPIYLDAIGKSLDLSEGIEISTLKDILGNKFPEDFSSLSKEEKEKTVQDLRYNLTPIERAKFNISLQERAMSLAQTMPPHQLTLMVEDIDRSITEIKNQNKNNNDPKIAETLQALKEHKQYFVNTMLEKVKGLANKDIIVDETNVADVYDGAIEMLNYLENPDNLSNIEQKDGDLKLVKTVRSEEGQLETAIREYDKLNNLTDIKEGDDEKLEKSFDRVWEIIKEIDLNDDKTKTEWLDTEISELLDSLQFEGKDAEDKKKDFNDTIKAEVAIRTALKSKDEKDENIKEIIKDELKSVTTSYCESIKTTDALVNLPNSASVEERKQALYNAASNREKNIISNNGAIAFQAAMVNKNISLLNRLANKINNRQAAVLQKMYSPIAKIDKTCIARFGSVYEITRSWGGAVLRNMCSQTLNQALRMGCNYGSLALGMPGVGNYVYAGVYATQAFVRLKKAFDFEREQAKANEEKFGIGKFLVQKSPEIALTLAGTAASVFGGAIAQQGLDAVVRYGMMGMGWMTSVCKGVHASRKQGENWGKSILKAMGNATFSTATAVATGVGISTAINHFSSTIHFDTFGEHGNRHANADEYNENDSSYEIKNITDPQTIEAIKDLTVEELNDAGVIRESISQNEANDLVNKTDTELMKDGIVRVQTNMEDPNGIKITDQPEGYKEGVIERAEDTIRYWTSADPKVYENNMSAYNDPTSPLSEWNANESNFKMDANRVELVIAECGGQMVAKDVDILTEHVNGDMNNEHSRQVQGNHKVFGEGWLAQHGKTYDISSEDIAKVAACHNPDGTVNFEALRQDGVLETIDKLDQIVSKFNEALDVETARDNAHDDGYLHRNAEIAPDGKHIHSDSQGELHHVYTDGEDPRSPEESHYERFDRYSKVVQNSFIPFTVTFDRMWGATKKFVLNQIMGANGKSKDKREGQSGQESVQGKGANAATAAERYAAPQNKNQR